MNRLSNKDLTKLVAIFLCCWIPLQVVYFSGKQKAIDSNINRALAAIDFRLALDLPNLELPTQLDSSNTEAPEQTPQIAEYIDLVNSYLSSNHWPVLLADIYTRPDEYLLQDEAANENVLLRVISFDRENVVVKIKQSKTSLQDYLSFYPLLAAVLLVIAFGDLLKISQKQAQVSSPERVEPALRIDLVNKVLINTLNGKTANIANKPLCFYSALIDFSLNYSDQQLNINKELPAELLEYADKYFFRLIDLGHTIRKRPNFNNNLEKVLSEIRASLDELFANDHVAKQKYHPPKAIGEGSRSKLHNFALTNLQCDDVTFVGK